MIASFRFIIRATIVAAAVVFITPVFSGGGPTPVGNFGPTGIEISVQPDHTLKVLKVQEGSPAEGKLFAGETILTVNGKTPVHEEKDPTVVFSTFKQLAAFITTAESTDGALQFKVKSAKTDTMRETTVKIPILGSYSPTWPLNCKKSDAIVRANAGFIASVAGPNGKGLTAHNHYTGFAILMLLSTGEEKDLEVVKEVYKSRMATFEGTDTGSHNWHNGLQGIAACEYFLRTGDSSVIPLINAICESNRKYQVYGGWSHWAKGINPQYTAGGHMNSAGAQNLTTLLLAKQCGATVNHDTLLSALRFFYRFVGHGNTPYGDHRPEDGLTDNGKTGMVALAMSVAARAENGEIYALARDKNAQTALYNYPALLRGHTGANGAKWHGIAAAWMADKKPKLHRNQLENKKWFFELSRRHTGAMGACGTGRYDNQSDGYMTGLTFTAPRKTLQITGAPKSPYARAFRLPARPWGRRADVTFFSLDGGPAYKGTDNPPHVELQKISQADKETLQCIASHPEHVMREAAASAIRDKGMFDLIEELLASEDPLAQHTGCMAINDVQPWSLRFAKGARSQASIDPEHFTPAMFNSLMAIITNSESALWSVDQALPAIAVASQAQVKSRLDDLIPWLEHSEWLLNESAAIALTPAMTDEDAFTKIQPAMVDSMAKNMHIKGRGVMGWAVKQATATGSKAIQDMVTGMNAELLEAFISVPNPEPGVDLSGITSVALEGFLGGLLRDKDWQIREDPKMILKGARLIVDRLDELRSRERDRVIELLIQASEKLKGQDRKALGTILLKHFRPLVIGGNPDDFKTRLEAGGLREQLDIILAIDDLAGAPGGWKVLSGTDAGKQTWWHTSFEPETKPADSAYNRYRKIKIPQRLTDWYRPDYDPAENSWLKETGIPSDGPTPKAYGVSREWFSKHLPKAGEAIFIRKVFQLDDLDFELMRLTVYSRQGYDVYLNGHRIVAKKGRSKTWGAQRTYFNDALKKHLKVGKNVIAAHSFLQYFRGLGGGIDVFVEKLETFPSVK